jgi:erythromycin esterase-like protein
VILKRVSQENSLIKKQETEEEVRAISVVYNPEYKRFRNYVPTDLTKRCDAFLYIDKTHALYPLHMPEVKEATVIADRNM